MSSVEIKPVYVLHGSDAFLRDEHRAAIVARVAGDADPQLCVSSFDASAELAEVLDELRTVPFLAPVRIVIVRDADAFVSAHRPQLEKYLNSPSSSGTLILAVTSWTSTTRLAKLVKKIGQTLDCTAPKKSDLGRWLRSALTARGKKIEPQAAELMLDAVGADLSGLSAEVEKLSLYVGPRDTITAKDVSTLVTATAGPEAFALSNAITEGNTPAALKALGGMVVRRGDEQKTLGMIGWHLRRSLLALQELAEGRRISLRMPYSQIPVFTQMLRRRGRRKLQEDFRRLIRCDLAIKSGANVPATMQQLVVALCT